MYNNIMSSFTENDSLGRKLSVIGDDIAYHVADGGYFDNHGVATALQFLDKVLATNSTDSIEHILFIQIRSPGKAESSVEESGRFLPNADESGGLKFSTIGAARNLAPCSHYIASIA